MAPLLLQAGQGLGAMASPEHNRVFAVLRDVHPCTSMLSNLREKNPIFFNVHPPPSTLSNEKPVYHNA
jgi:hypothetical protein